MLFRSSDLPYDTLRDFAPLTLIGSSMLAMVASPSLPATSVPELISLAQSSRDPLAFASLGVNNTTHLAGELFNAMAGTRLVHVPYNGSPPAYQDMLAGRVPLGFVTLQSALPHLKSGRLKLIGLVASRRNRSYPDLPVIGERSEEHTSELQSH